MGVPVYLLRSRSAALVTASPEIAEPVVRGTPQGVAKQVTSEIDTAASMPILGAAPLVEALSPELRLPAAHLQRFSTSRLFQHLCLALGYPVAEVAIVENPVLSDTGLHFHRPGKAPLKLGALALLNSNWRARRSAWQAIRGWRA